MDHQEGTEMEDAKSARIRAEILNCVNELEQGITRIDSIFRRLTDHCSSLFDPQENLTMDSAESARLVAEIDFLNEERREEFVRVTCIIQHCSSLYAEMRDTEKFEQHAEVYAKGIAGLDHVSRKQKEAVKRLEYVMKQVTDYCKLRFTSLFDMVFEE
ncbi:uncharacterized protein LOC117648044 [Thrips palmi]|uniref:Uncharacterized protein LOC117648044 n=1 Tax=Thrips palmi TaxID=161013 RepID=A0A6P8Z7K6_THRPL|nr:uncharacterized protein LOC117648044 [Thrips palmi]